MKYVKSQTMLTPLVSLQYGNAKNFKILIKIAESS